MLCNWSQYLDINSKDTENPISTPNKNFLTFAWGYLVKYCNFYPRLSLETVFPALKLTQICYINMNISFLKNWKFNHKLSPPLLHTPPLSSTPSLKDSKVSRKQKLQFSNSLVNWEKFGSTTTNIQKSQYSNSSMNWKKIEKTN